MSSSARKLRRSAGNYAAAVLKLARESDLPPGSVSEAIVMHEDRCRIFRGEPCDCSPSIELVPFPDPEAN